MLTKLMFTLKIIFKMTKQQYIKKIFYLTLSFLVLLNLLIFIPNIIYHSTSRFVFADYNLQITGDITRKVEDWLKSHKEIYDVFSAYHVFNVEFFKEDKISIGDLFLINEETASLIDYSWFNRRNLFKGRNPVNHGEIAISYNIAKIMDAKIGDTIKTNLADTEYKLEVVGIYLFIQDHSVASFDTHNYNKITNTYRNFLLENEYKPLGILDSYPLMHDVSSYTISWVKTELSVKELTGIVEKLIPAYNFMIFDRNEIIENILTQYGFLEFKNLLLFIFIILFILLFISYREAIAFKKDFAPYQFVLEIIGLNKKILIFGIALYNFIFLTIANLLAYFTTLYLTYPFIFNNLIYLPMPSLLKIYLLIIIFIIISIVMVAMVLIYNYSKDYQIKDLNDFKLEF